MLKIIIILNLSDQAVQDPFIHSIVHKVQQNIWLYPKTHTHTG